MLRLFKRRSLDDSDRISRKAVEVAERLREITHSESTIKTLRRLLHGIPEERRHEDRRVLVERRAQR